MTAPLRPWSMIDDFQHAATDWLYDHDEALAILETGSGKTMIAMTAGDELMKAGLIRHPLVLAPLRVGQITWPAERGEWEHLKHLEMTNWSGEPAGWPDSLWKKSRILWGQREHVQSRLPKIEDVIERRKVEQRIKYLIAEERDINARLRTMAPPDGVWTVTSHENIEWLCALYKPGESPFDLWVIDETGKFRNPRSPRYKALAKHAPRAKIRWGLNATPAPEGLLDLYPQVRVVDGGKLWGRSFYQWRQKFFAPTDYMGYAWRPQLGAFDLIMADLNTLAFRVPAEQLTYQKTIRHSQIKIELPPKARAAYDEMEKTLAVELGIAGLAGLSAEEMIVAMSEAAASTKLRQITQGYIYETDARGRRIVHILHEEKLHAVADLVDSMGGEPVLIAYAFDQDLANLQKLWKNVPYLGQGVDSATAKDHVERWNRRELPVLALHPNSASHGLNLQYGGHHICWMALPWGLDPYIQTNQRIDRRGQLHACFGHHIVALDSKDQDVSNVLIDKDSSQQQVIAAIRAV